MKRAVVATVLAAVFVLAQTGMISAATTTSKVFNLTATVQPASSISINAFRVNSDKTLTALSTTTLSFDTMAFDTTYNIFRPDHGFAIDVSANGAGSITTVVTYAEGAKPTGALKALGGASFATFVKALDTTPPSDVLIATKALTALNQTITPAQVSGGWLRTYLAISVGAAGEPTGVAPFTALDKTGAYDGTLTFTVTVA